MTARLFSKTSETRGLELEIDARREAIVGRDPQSDLVIERPLMSSRHARIFYDGDAGRFVLEDLESLNGTEIDGDRITGAEPLGHLHVITFAGSYEFFFFDSERSARRHPEPPAEAAPATEEEPASAEPAGEKPAPSDTDEVTSVEREPVALPGFLARRADAISDSGEADAARPAVPSEVTSIEREPVALPDFLARKADEARGDQAEDAEAHVEDAEDRAEDAEALVEKTMREKLPVALPGILARRAEEAAREDEPPDVQKETVDLADIEDLITAEEAADSGDAGSGRASTDLVLVVTDPTESVAQFPLMEGENLVGRGSSVHVALRYPDLSRHHAALTVTGGKVTVRDLGSRNRTFVDDVALEAQTDVEVEPGVRLRFGSVEARLTRPAIRRGDP